MHKYQRRRREGALGLLHVLGKDLREQQRDARADPRWEPGSTTAVRKGVVIARPRASSRDGLIFVVFLKVVATIAREIALFAIFRTTANDVFVARMTPVPRGTGPGQARAQRQRFAYTSLPVPYGAPRHERSHRNSPWRVASLAAVAISFTVEFRSAVANARHRLTQYKRQTPGDRGTQSQRDSLSRLGCYQMGDRWV